MAELPRHFQGNLPVRKVKRIQYGIESFSATATRPCSYGVGSAITAAFILPWGRAALFPQHFDQTGVISAGAGHLVDGLCPPNAALAGSCCFCRHRYAKNQLRSCRGSYYPSFRDSMASRRMEAQRCRLCCSLVSNRNGIVLNAP